MLKKIKIKVHSHIDNLDGSGLPEGDPEINDSAHDGILKLSDGETSLSYNEDSEGGRVFSDILLKNGTVTVHRGGAIVSTLFFEPCGVFKTIYEIPPYKFDMTVTTKRIRGSLDESGGEIDILYEMEVGGAKKLARMRISALEAGAK